ncbi:NAD(P)/FAD-dependent oxidoreductase [Nocardioides carbamazepini]|uniref:flavin-containing monooxygenase n=1 Tax=Nocardioides carbamazepini TaxID=2854259 RepID=UPI002149F378|nr:NAD(P)/FAD-dependent oxidoreductase [Nocardioides carbamazepini]MCR1783779.1 NAD(P)/FAD-dependent oxidoreductase [Nocardioides carbamazepini]
MNRDSATPPTFEHVDVLVVGAGLTGIGMGYHLRTLQPDKTFAIVEAREAIGGTWDLFRYPGIRSDADLHTFGFGFKPWTRDNAIANADEILDYLQETVDEFDLSQHLHLGHKVVAANFSTEEARWVVTLERSGDGERFDVSCGMLFSAAGYYDVDNGYTPHFEGREQFEGDIVHPQHWPEDLDYTGKKVVVIGSGATAVTLIPAMAETAGHVTMLQRSPSYVLPAPRQDPIANTLRRLLPERAAYAVTRSINVNKQDLLYKASRRFPKQMRALVRRVNMGALPEGYDVDTHFKPSYAPWDQRMCVVPDSDLFKAISSGAASVVTDRIERFTAQGIRLASGAELEADVIVTATGLNMVPFGKIPLQVDGTSVNLHDHVAYKGLMVSDIPNFVFTVGYVNHAWTLKADLVAQWFCRLLAHMDRNGFATATPVVDDATMTMAPLIDMGTGYVNRAMHLFPQQGSRGPWRLDQDYKADRTILGTDPIEDSGLVFSEAAGHFAQVAEAAALGSLAASTAR